MVSRSERRASSFRLGLAAAVAAVGEASATTDLAASAALLVAAPRALWMSSRCRGPAAEAGGQGRRSPSKAAPEGRAVSESDAESNDNSEDEDDDEDDPAGFATEPESEDDGGAQGGVRGPQRQRGSSLKLAAQFESKIGSLKRRSVRVSSWPCRGRRN